MCEEPTDVTLFILKLLTRCIPERFKCAVAAVYIFRCLLSLASDYAFATKIYLDILIEYLPEEIQQSPWPLRGYAIFYFLCMCVLLYQIIKVVKGKMEKRTFMLTYKAIDLFLSAVNVAGLIIARDDVDFKDWQDVVVVVFVGLDVVVDSVEIIVYCCMSPYEEYARPCEV